jgi:hypothetical protein
MNWTFLDHYTNLKRKNTMKWTRKPALFGLLAVGPALMFGCDSDSSGPDIPDPPSAPTGVTLSVAGQTITVSWTASASADSYRVVLSTDGEANREETPSATTVDFSNLTPAKTYFAQVFAVNTGGSSPAATGTATTEAEPETFVNVTQDILTNTTWTSDKIWILNQPIFVGVDCGPDGTKAGCVEATLTIEPGTTVLGKSDVPQGVRGAYLVVNRGSRLVADATGADRPPTEEEVIVFTSDKPRGQRAVEDWGGMIINGQAPTNAGDEAQGEGDSGFYGGTDVNDDSGILRGVRIEFAGDDVTPADQLNGLALQGVGAGTTISYLQIHYNKDDGIEPFGGTVSVDHLVVTGIGDDSVDGTDGYRGFMQFIIGQQRGADADQGFEISNNGDVGDATPKSTAVLANATMIGANQGVVTGDIAGAESDDAIQMREGTNYRVYNSIFQGFGDSGFCIRDAQSIVNANARLGGDATPSNTLSAEGLIMWSNGGTAGGTDSNFNACGGGSTVALNKQFFETAGFNNMLADPGFDASAFNMGTQSNPPDFTLAAMPGGYTAFDLAGVAFNATDLIAPTDGRTLVDTDYAGAIAPGTTLTNAWYYGWTVWASAGQDSRPNQDGN